MTYTRLALVGVNALFVGLIAAGCSDNGGDNGGDSADGDSGGNDQTESAYTVDEMCQEFEDRINSGESDDFAEIRSYILDLHERGLPDEAPEDAVKGLKTSAQVLKDADTEQEADAAAEKLPDDERSSMSDFTSYVDEECGPESPSPTVPSDLGTDLPSDVPTDIPSIDPSDIPTDLESMFPSGVPSELESLLPSE